MVQQVPLTEVVNSDEVLRSGILRDPAVQEHHSNIQHQVIRYHSSMQYQVIWYRSRAPCVVRVQQVPLTEVVNSDEVLRSGILRDPAVQEQLIPLLAEGQQVRTLVATDV
jgi:hypothetical protein